MAHKQRPSRDAGRRLKASVWRRSSQRSVLRKTQVAHKERRKGDIGQRLKASVWRRSPLKKRPKGDAGCTRNFLKGGLHASCGKYPVAHKERPKGDAGCARNFLKGGLHASYGKYPGSYPFPKGGMIVTQLPISSILQETQSDDQAILRDMQNTPGAL
ncbi:unnamed protein product [Prunus armeniaca]